MSTYLYRDSRMEQELRGKIHAIANKKYGGAIPADVRDRIAAEERHIFDNGHGTLLAVVAKLAKFSESRGCPVGFRGLTGNLYLSHLLGLAAVDPMELGLRWEGCLGMDGTRAPVFTLNVAGELLENMTAYLGELLPGYDPSDEHPAIRLCPHELMDRVREARQAGGVPAAGNVLSDGSLVLRAYRGDVAGIPVLDDLEGFQDLARRLEPEAFSDLVKIMGLCLAPEVQFQADRLKGQSDRFDCLTGTREDVYDMCARHGVSGDDAFQVMRQVSRGRLAPEYRDMLAARGLPSVFLETLDAAEYLYPRGQCADYLYWALTLLSHKIKETRRRMDRDELLALADVGQDEAQRLSRELGKPIDIDRKALIMLARIAVHKEDGEDYMRSRVRMLVADMIRRFPELSAYRYEYEPPDADERRQAGTFLHGVSLL